MVAFTPHPDSVYFDQQNEQWVGEFETRAPNGDLRRETEWFDSEGEAKRFARTGERE